MNRDRTGLRRCAPSARLHDHFLLILYISSHPTPHACKLIHASMDTQPQARFFLSGINHNTVDGAMEHGFQTNVDLLRACRPRWLERGSQNKWDDVLTFKPRPAKNRNDEPEEKPPWWRLGKKYL